MPVETQVRVGVVGRKTDPPMPDHARATGAAIEAHYRSILWLVPTVERFARNRKFLLGDRMQVTATEVLERLIEGSYTKRRTGLLADANLGLERLRFPLRITYDLRVIDRRRYEFASRCFDVTVRRVGAWRKVHPAKNSAEAV